DVCERWLPRIERKRDLFGIADVIAVRPRGRTTLLVQATTLAHVGDRLKYSKGRPELETLLAVGIAVEVWGWCQRGGRWQVKRVAVRPEDLAAVTVQALPRPRRTRQGELFD